MNWPTDCIICQLYASLYEWCTGKHRAVGFFANMFLDVYFGHINTIKVIMERNNTAFHSMLAEIYERARYVIQYLFYVAVMDIYDLSVVRDHHLGLLWVCPLQNLTSMDLKFDDLST